MAKPALPESCTKDFSVSWLKTMENNDAIAEANVQVQNYLGYAIENARSALTLMALPATRENAINYVCETLARIATE